MYKATSKKIELRLQKKLIIIVSFNMMTEIYHFFCAVLPNSH